MKILNGLLLATAALGFSVQADARVACTKIMMFQNHDGNFINPAIAVTREGSGFVNQDVTVNLYDAPFLIEQPLEGPCTCLCGGIRPSTDFYYSANPIDSSNLMTSNQFFNFISTSVLGNLPIREYRQYEFSEPRIIKITPRSGPSFNAIIAKIMPRFGTFNYSFYAGFEVEGVPVEEDGYIPCASLTQHEVISNWPIPGLIQVQLDPADTLDSIAFIRLARNTSANRQIAECRRQ